MMREKSRRPSPLQRRVLIVLAALDAKRPGPVATRDIERVLEQGGDAPVYGPNLRASCRRMEAAGWLEVHQARNSSRRGNKIPFRRRIDSSKPTCRQNRCCKNGSDHRFVF
ncbi:Uncharacterised protein [Klebsiella quasipneumoniae]|nr:Uncharacterised protein [Klebsiella quasipneumoniae]